MKTFFPKKENGTNTMEVAYDLELVKQQWQMCINK